MAKFANLVRMFSSTVGDGATLTVTSIVPGFLDLGDAGVIDGEDYSYAINDYNASGNVFQTEDGHGIVDTTAGTIVRNVTNSSNGNNRISLTGTQQVILTPRAEDLLSMTELQDANKVLAGPTNGADAAPTFRTLVAADIPALPYGTVTSVSSGDLAPLFTTNVANPTTTPAITYALSNAAATTYLGSIAGGAPSYVTAGAITKTDDTNVTLTLGGAFANALLAAASFTLGWTGLLSPARGGTGVNNGANTITLGGNVSTGGAVTTVGALTTAGAFTTSGSFTTTFTMTGNTAVTFPTTGTLATLADIPAAGANTALSNLASVAINTTLLPGSNDGAALGSGTLSFSDLFLASGGVVNWANGLVTFSHDAANDRITLAGSDFDQLFVEASASSAYTFRNQSGVGGTVSFNIGGSNTGDGTLGVARNSDGSARVNLSGATGEITGDMLSLRELSGGSVSSLTLSIVATEDLTSDRVLSVEVADADRTVVFQGNPTFKATGDYYPGGPTVIASGSFGAANTQVFSTAIPETYAYIVLEYTGLSSDTATRFPLFQVSVDAGSSYDTTASNYPGYVISAVQNGGTAALATNTVASLAMTMTAQVAANTFSGVIEIFNYQGTMPHFRGHNITGGSTRNEFSGSYIGSTLNIDGLRMIWNSTGSSDAGTYVLKGYS